MPGCDLTGDFLRLCAIGPGYFGHPDQIRSIPVGKIGNGFHQFHRPGTPAQLHQAHRAPPIEAGPFGKLAACHDGSAQRLVRRFQPGSRVHGIAQSRILDTGVAAEIPDHRLAPVEADARLADRRKRRVHGFYFLAKRLARLPQGVTRFGSAFAIVRARDRRAPEGDNGIADELVDHPAMIEHDLAKQFKVPVEQTGDHLRFEGMAHFGKPLEIRKQDVNLFLFAMQLEQVGILDNFAGHLAREVFAQRPLREIALDRSRSARGRGDGGERDDPPQQPAGGGQSVGVDALDLHEEGCAQNHRELDGEQDVDLPCSPFQQACQDCHEYDEECQRPQRQGRDGWQPRPVEHLGDHFGMHFDARGIDAGFRLLRRTATQRAGERGGHPVDIDNVPADQHIAALDEGLHASRHFGIGEQLDRQGHEDRLRIVCPQAIADRAFITGQGQVFSPAFAQHDAAQKIGNVGANFAPPAGDPAATIAQPHASRNGCTAFEGGKEIVQIGLLIVGDTAQVRARFRVADRGGRIERPQRFDQFRILVLGLVEKDIDTDRLRIHRVDIAQCFDQHPPVERRALARVHQCLVVIDDEDDAIVLRHGMALCVESIAGVVQFALCLGYAGYVGRTDAPAEPRQHQRRQNQGRRDCQPTRSGFAHIAPATPPQILA